MAVDWCSLPFDLLGAIAMKLGTFEEFLNYSLVCRCWNRASYSIKHHWRALPEVPWLLLAENTQENPDGIRKIFNIDSNKCYNFNLPEISEARCWGSPYGWVAIAKLDYSIHLFNPITKAQIHFPSLETLSKPPRYEIFDDDDGDEKFRRLFLVSFLTKVIVLKLSQNGRDEFVIMVLLDRLAFARHGDPSWTFVFVKDASAKILESDYFPPMIVDVMAFDDHVFVLYCDREVGVWNVEDFSRLELIVPKSFSPGFEVHYSLEELENHDEFEVNEYTLQKMYLVRSGSDLLMVLRYKDQVSFDTHEIEDYDQVMYPTIGFKVYRFKPENKSWEEIQELGEVVLFVGDNFSMSISTANARCLHSNSIYFTDDENDAWLLCWYGFHDIGVYDLKRNEIRRFYEGRDTSSLLCTATFFVPQF